MSIVTRSFAAHLPEIARRAYALSLTLGEWTKDGTEIGADIETVYALAHLHGVVVSLRAAFQNGRHDEATRHYAILAIRIAAMLHVRGLEFELEKVGLIRSWGNDKQLHFLHGEIARCMETRHNKACLQHHLLTILGQIATIDHPPDEMGHISQAIWTILEQTTDELTVIVEQSLARGTHA